MIGASQPGTSPRTTDPPVRAPDGDDLVSCGLYRDHYGGGIRLFVGDAYGPHTAKIPANLPGGEGLMYRNRTDRKMLTDSQRREFHRNGFLVVESGIDESLIDRAREAVWTAIDEDEDDRSTWAGENRSVSPEDTGDEEPFREINDRLFEFAESMVGDGRLPYESGPGAQLALRFPREEELTDPEAPQLSDVESHVDGTLNVEDGEGDVVPHTINGVAYLDRVQPYGGGFTAWPGSHRDVCRYVADHPIQSVQGGIRAPDGEGGWDETRSRDEVFDPLELTGDPGTVVLWHGRLEHEGGINLRPGNVRMAHIKRFFHEDAWEMQERAPEEPYLGWDAMAGVVGDDYRI